MNRMRLNNVLQEVQFLCRATDLETRHTTDKLRGVNLYDEALFDFLIRCLSWRDGRETPTERSKRLLP